MARITPADLRSQDAGEAPALVEAFAPLDTTLRTRTTSGATSARIHNAVSGAAKAAPGVLYGVHVFNTNAAARYLKIYNATTAPAAGASTPVVTVPVAPGGRADFSNVMGLSTFSTGISWRAGTAYADTDAVDAAATDLTGMLTFA